MEGGRTLADNKVKERTRIRLSSTLFDFVNKLVIGDKGILNVTGKITNERKPEQNENNDTIIKTFRIIKAKLNKEKRI